MGVFEILFAVALLIVIGYAIYRAVTPPPSGPATGRITSVLPGTICSGDSTTVSWTSSGGSPVINATGPAGTLVSPSSVSVAASGRFPFRVTNPSGGVITFRLTVTPARGAAVTDTAPVILIGTALAQIFAPLGSPDCGRVQFRAFAGVGVSPISIDANSWIGTLIVDPIAYASHIRVAKVARAAGVARRDMYMRIDSGTTPGITIVLPLDGSPLDVSTLNLTVGTEWKFFAPLVDREYCRNDTPPGESPSVPPGMGVLAELICVH